MPLKVAATIHLYILELDNSSHCLGSLAHIAECSISQILPEWMLEICALLFIQIVGSIVTIDTVFHHFIKK